MKPVTHCGIIIIHEALIQSLIEDNDFMQECLGLGFCISALVKWRPDDHLTTTR